MGTDRQTQEGVRHFLRNREISPFEAHVGIRFGKMRRDGIMDHRGNSKLFELPLHLIPIFDPDDELMPHAVIQMAFRQDDFRNIRKTVKILFRDMPPSRIPVIQMRRFHGQKSSLQRIDPPVVAFDLIMKPV